MYYTRESPTSKNGHDPCCSLNERLSKTAHPSLGRFLNRDPIGFAGGLNQFEFARSNPVTLTDHTGLQPGTKQQVDMVQAARQIVWDYAASGGTNATALARLLTQAGYGGIAWLVTQEAGDGTFDAFGPRGMEIINSGDYSFSGLNEGGDAVGVHSTAMRFKRMADAQGGGGLSDPCAGLRFRGRVWKVTDHFEERINRPGVSLRLDEVQDILDIYGAQARFLKPGRSPNSELYDIGGYNFLINPVRRTFISIW